MPGVWGPYYSAILPEFWLLEGGQTAVGSLIDHIMESHPAYQEAVAEAAAKSKPVHAYLDDQVSILAGKLDLTDTAYLTADLHIWPDYHGNRAPLADPDMTGMVCGLRLEKSSVQNLALHYLAAIQAVAYGTKAIVEQIKSHSDR